MAEEPAFDFLCVELERASTLDRLEARGTVRIAIKQAGLDPHTATPQELSVVVQKVLPAELASRGVENPDTLCDQLAKQVAIRVVEEPRETPEAIFARLGSR